MQNDAVYETDGFLCERNSMKHALEISVANGIIPKRSERTYVRIIHGSVSTYIDAITTTC